MTEPSEAAKQRAREIVAAVDTWRTDWRETLINAVAAELSAKDAEIEQLKAQLAVARSVNQSRQMR